MESIFDQVERPSIIQCRAAYSPEAILFDMDGVLADVGDSYRRCIIEASAVLGVEVTSEDIKEAKAAGDANNDWLLTQRLVNEKLPADKAVTFEAAKEEFEKLYQGCDGHEGLYKTEQLLVDPLLLKDLSEKMPLAIVTGRPRNPDCIRFLEEQGIAQYFKAVVCMEDGPPKPAPDVVQIAMQKLGVKRAYMIGDTPDDINAATAAGLPGLGIPAPGKDADAAPLRRSGAACILKDLEELRAFL